MPQIIRPPQARAGARLRHEDHLEVKATDGRTSTFALNEKTKIVRGKRKVKADDIAVGERVVVSARETKGQYRTPTLVATGVRLGPSPTTAKTQ